MGCNCGDNEYEIIVDNNGSCEPTTPEYYITLENVGVDGFSPTINQVNVTSSSFQLQITDVNGVETTGNIPLLSYLDNNFVTNTDLATTLADYVTNSNLTTTLTNYVTNSSLSSTLNNYVTNSSLSSTLSAYALDANVVHNTGNESISGTKTFNNKILSPSIDAIAGGALSIGNSNAYYIYIGKTSNAYTRIRGNTVYLDGTNITAAGSNFTWNGKTVATTNQIPTIGNGTITITQGGVSKGTFTTNQSGNTTIDLDAGGGGSSYTAGNGINITNDTISIDTSVVATLNDIPDTSDMATKTWVGNQGYLTATALTNYVDISSDQTITGYKTFNNVQGISAPFGVATNSITPADIYSGLNLDVLSTSLDKSITIGYSRAVDIFIGNNNSTIRLAGSTATLNGNVIATTNQLPTVNNPTITFTQGGVTKGTITLNQSSNQTIALDAGGGGGGVVIDDTTPSTTTVYSSQKTQDLIDALLARIAALEANINGGNA